MEKEDFKDLSLDELLSAYNIVEEFILYLEKYLTEIDPKGTEV